MGRKFSAISFFILVSYASSSMAAPPPVPLQPQSEPVTISQNDPYGYPAQSPYATPARSPYAAPAQPPAYAAPAPEPKKIDIMQMNSF